MEGDAVVARRGKSKLPKPGDRVRVPFGFSKVEGVVLRNDGVTESSITVQFEVEGADGDFINNYEPDRVEIIKVA